MPFICRSAPEPRAKQMSIWDILSFNEFHDRQSLTNPSSNTITRWYNVVPENLSNNALVQKIIDNLHLFNSIYEDLQKSDLSSHYSTAVIPKKSFDEYGHRKTRIITMPDDEIDKAHAALKAILSMPNCPTHHTSAFGYVCGRSAKDVSKKHQYNQSHWWLLTDFHDFFGSINYDFTIRMFEKIYPYSEILCREDGRTELTKALKLCFLNDGLPQGTRISPMLTNIVMIPFDYMLSKELRGSFVYTRYADDIQISSREKFNKSEVLNILSSILKRIDAPFKIAPEKTKFLSGAVYVLGVMYNERCERTVGHKNKKAFRATLYNYLTDRVQGHFWDKHSLQVLFGNYSYYHSIEPKYFEDILKQYSDKFKFSVENALRSDLRKC